jgi:hypothetical protein
MMFVMLVAAIGLVVAGLLAIAYGIGVQLSTGNTLIVAGVIGVCTGMIMLGLWMTVRELKNIARQLGAGVPEAGGEGMVRPAVSVAGARDSAAGGGFPAAEQAGGSGPLSPATPPPFSPAAPPPWQNEAVLRDHPIPEPMHPEPPPEPKPKRNLLFSSTSRKGRERAQARTGEPLPPDLMSSDLRSRPPIVPPVETAEPQPASFDDTWPKAGRATAGEIPPPRRSGRRMPPTLAEANSGPAHPEDRPEVTVLKSGIVDGMAYSLYSDGSIEAQMPEGMMRFASIDELRAHLDQRA